MFTNDFALSGDSAFFTSPSAVKTIYGKYATAELGFIGIEVIGWWYLKKYLIKATELNIPISGIHGRVGKKSDSRMSVINSLLVATPELIRLVYNREIKYLLLHSLEAEAKIDLLEKVTGQIRIEGDRTITGGIDKAHDLVKRLISCGVDAVLNPDIAHLYLEHNSLPINSQSAVEMTINYIAKEDKKLPLALHLPIGEDTQDSINIFKVNSSSLFELGRLIKNRKIHLCIENQLGSKIWNTANFLIDYQKTTVAKMDRLAEYKII